MPRSEFLSFSPPYTTEAEVNAVAEVIREGTWLSSGPRTKLFEENFKKTVGADAALALNSATAGLHLGIVVHGIGEGDEVITTPMTFCASSNVVEHQRGTVVLADIDPETLLIDPREIEKKISKKTKAIMPVHYSGQPCDMAAIDQMAQAQKIAVIEDAAHCMPSKIGDKWVGSSPNLTLFSFYANKNMTTGEGGMMTGPQELVDRARVMALHGMTRNAWDRFAKGGSWKYDVPAPGFKYNMTDAASALGLVQLARLPELYQKRMAIVNAYEAAFKNHKHIQTIKVRPGVQSSYHLYVIQLHLETLTIDRDRFINELTERNIGTSVHYTPVHMMSYYSKKYGWKPESFPNAYRAFTRMLSIPLSSKMSVKDAEDVIDAVNDVCTKFKR